MIRTITHPGRNILVFPGVRYHTLKKVNINGKMTKVKIMFRRFEDLAKTDLDNHANPSLRNKESLLKNLREERDDFHPLEVVTLIEFEA